MKVKAVTLAARRGALGERIANQRATLARNAEGIERLCAGGDTLLHGADWLKQHPATVGLAAFALVLLRPRHAFRWTRRGFFLWQGWRKAKGWLAAR